MNPIGQKNLSDTLSFLQKRRQQVISGGINCIPTSLKRFSVYFPGLETGKMYLISANQKIGKTQYTCYLLFDAILYAFKNKDKIKLRIQYFPLEETDQNIFLRFVSYILYLYSNKQIRLSIDDLKSTRKESPLSQEILAKLDSPEYKEIFLFFYECVDFREERNPTGIKKAIEDYILSVGNVTTTQIEITDNFGEKKEINKFNKYEKHNPNEYFFSVIDHIGLISTENGMSIKQSIDRMSAYLVKLRNKYSCIYSPIIIQQQFSEAESNESFKLNRMRPSERGLADSKYTGRDCDVMFGLFSPYRHEIKDYLHYDITRFKNNIRFLEVVINRSGESNSICPLYFDGAVNYFEELPRPDEAEELQRFYSIIEKVKGNFSFFTFYKHKKQKKLWEKLLVFLGHLAMGRRLR